jgi:hypothetical protein
MEEKGPQLSVARRLFLARLGAGASVVGATIAPHPLRWRRSRRTRPGVPLATPKTIGSTKSPASTASTTSTDGMASALRFADNYYVASGDAYGLKESDLAVLIVARHKSTPFGYNDFIWAKYAKQLAELGQYTDPKTDEAPNVNIYARPGDASNQAGRLDGLIKRGARVVACQMSSREIASSIAKATGGDADVILKEIGANLVGNGRFVPAGIVAVNRAQEYGYSFVSCD